jgi:tetratricopeptide (TPR) repeat protein
LHQQVISTLEQCLHHKLLGFLEDNWLEESKEMLSEEPNLERDFPLLVEDREIIEQIEQQQLPIQALMLYEKGRPVEDFVLYERLPYLKTALELAPNFAQARIAYAIVLAEKGHLGQAQTEMEKAIAQLKTPQIGWFHLAGIAFLRQDIETAKALWRRCFESNMQPWREYAADNLEAIASRNTTRLLIVALPTYHRVVEFTSNSAILSADRSSSDSLFRTTPSVELKTLSFPLETARKQAQIEIPRFSEVVGMSELENNINKNQLDAEHIAAKRQQILGETKKLSEVAIFDLSQAPEQEHTASSSFLSDYELDEHLSSHSTTNDYSTQAPLFDISPSVETNSPDFSIELAPQEAIAKIPLLSEVAPTYPEQQPPIASQSPTDKNIDPQNFDQSLKPGVPQNFNQAPTPRVPDVSPQAPNAPVESSQPSEMKRKNIILANSTTCKIFSKHEDIDSFIDEVFADLEHHSQPDLPEYQDKSSDNSK